MVTGASTQVGLSKESDITGTYDPLYLFACQLEWHRGQNLAAYQELVAALDDSDDRVREVAEMLLRRSSPRPQTEERHGRSR